MRTIVAIGAHSDDIDLRAGASLSSYLHQGYSIVYVVLTTSASGVPSLSPNEAFAIRQKEAIAAAKLYNTKPIFLNFQKTVTDGPDEKLPVDKPYIATALRNPIAIKSVQNILETYQPEAVFTHNPNDIHEDHYHTSAIVHKAYMTSSIKDSSRLLMWETGSRGRIIDFIPTTFIDVTNEDVVFKDRAVKTHISQYKICPWFENFAFENAKHWGQISQNEYAEAFIQVHQ